MSDETPIRVKSPSADLARVPVETTLNAPAMPAGGMADVPVYAVVIEGEMDPPTRRRAAAIAGASEGALRRAAEVGPVVLARASSEVRASQIAAGFRAAGVSVAVVPPGSSDAIRQGLIVMGLGLLLSLGVGFVAPVLAVLLPLLVLVASLAIGTALYSRGKPTAEQSAITASGDIVDLDKALDADARAGDLVAQVQRLRRAVVHADANDRVEADLLGGLDDALQGLRKLDEDSETRARLSESLDALEQTVRALKAADADDPGAAIEAVNAKAKEAADASLELKRRLAQAEAARGQSR